MPSNSPASSGPTVCGVCGTPLPAQLGGQCPRCLLGLAEEFGGTVGQTAGTDTPGEFPARPFGDYELLGEIARAAWASFTGPGSAA